MSLFDINHYQVMLMDDSELEPIEWIQLYSARFRDLVEGGVSNIEDLKLFLYEN